MAKQRRNVVGQPGQARAGGFFSKGVDLKAKGEYSRAATSFTQHIERYPSHVGAYIQRSSCFLKLGLVESALIDAQLATELDPSSDKAIVAKADALLELEQLDEALVLYGDLFSRTTPDHPDRYRYKYGLQQCLEGKKATSFREGMEGVAMTLPSAAPESSVRSSVSPFPPSPSSARRSADEIEVSKVLADSAVNDILLRRVRMYSNEGDYKCVKQKVGADAKLRHVPSSITAKNTIPITVGSDRGASLFPTSGVSGNDAASRSRSGSPSKYSSRDNLSAGLDSLFMKSLGSERREEVRRARRMGKHVEGATEAKKLDEYFYFQDEIKVLDQSVEDRSKAAKTRRELLHKYRGQAFRTAQAMTSSSPLSPSNYQEPTLARLNGGGGTVIAPFDDGQRRGSPIEHPHRPEPPSQPRRPASAKHVRSSGGGVRNKRRLLSARQRGQQESDVQRTEIVEAYASLPTSRLAVRVEHRGEY
uniref:Outer dynein arm-docking complex subunit 4 n=2 Tax=Palpitomonas bilix TaxID=652834 RepID=A0A7S3DLI3_9EUKA|mmetsp:Transcript_43202/g.112058  ORF Transcript_43202/g.112058 Transcript_43202/m.112058 type:complete len:476 (+) Transcript_43202:209-1636(+)